MSYPPLKFFHEQYMHSPSFGEHGAEGQSKSDANQPCFDLESNIQNCHYSCQRRIALHKFISHNIVIIIIAPDGNESFMPYTAETDLPARQQKDNHKYHYSSLTRTEAIKLQIIRYTLHVTHYTLHITHYMLHITHHTFHITR